MNSRLILAGLIAIASACHNPGPATSDSGGAARPVNAVPSGDAGSVATPGAGDGKDAGTVDLDAGTSGPPAADAGPVDAGGSGLALIPPFPGVQATLVVEGPVRELLVAPDGEHVLFVRAERYTNCRLPLGRGAPLWLVDAKGGTPSVVNTSATRYSFSPAGSRFALIASDCWQVGTLVSYGADGTAETAVSSTAAFAYSGETLYSQDVAHPGIVRFAPSDAAPAQLAPSLLSFDPLGKAAYSCDGSTQRCLYFPTATDPASAVALDASRAGNAEWTPDGAWMVLADIAVSRDGTRQQRVGGSCMMNERLTPDGRAVVFARLPSGPDCDGVLVIHPLDGSPETQTGPLPFRLGGPDYKWDWALSDDGMRLLVSYQSIPSRAQGVLVASTNGGPLEELLPESYLQYSIAPDGSLYALEGVWPSLSIVQRRPGVPPETVMSGTDCLPVAGPSGALLVLQEDWSRSDPFQLHLLTAGASWPGVALPGQVVCQGGYSLPFPFGFVGKTPVYVASRGYDSDLVAVSDSGESGVLAAGISMFRVVGSTVYVVRASDRSLWRIEVPQPSR